MSLYQHPVLEAFLRQLYIANLVDAEAVMQYTKQPGGHRDPSTWDVIGIEDVQVLSALLSTPVLAELWAKRLRRTPATLVYPAVVYRFRETMDTIIPQRSFQDKTDTTKDWFRCAFEVAERFKRVFEPFVEFKLGCKFNAVSSPEHFIDLLIQYASSGDSKLFAEFIALNPPRSLADIKAHIEQLEHYLQGRVLGQSHAVRTVVRHELASGCIDNGRQRAIFTFVGPSGVGKTELARSYAHALSDATGSGYRFREFSMEAYADDKAYMKLTGSGSYYTDSALGDLTRHVQCYPRSVILFDEIEKAHPSVIQSMLSMLDSGRMTDITSNEVADFSQTIVIFTSNLGQAEFNKATGMGELDVFDVLRQAKRPGDSQPALTPELVDRLKSGAAIRFKPLSASTLLAIAELRVRDYLQAGFSVVDLDFTVDFYAALLFAQLPKPSARGIQGVANNLLAGAKRDMFRQLTSAQLQQITQLQLHLDESCYERVRGSHKVLLINCPATLVAHLQQQLPRYEWQAISLVAALELKHQVSQYAAVLIAAGVSADSSSATPELAELAAAIRQLHRFAAGVPLLMVAEHTIDDDEFDLLDEVISAASLLATPTRLQRLIEVNARLQIGRRQEQRFDYDYHLQLDSSQLKISLVNPKFTTNVSSSRVIAGVPGLLRERPSVRLADVVGLQRAKAELQRVLGWLKQPELLQRRQLAMPAGIVLTGPPGTGKTMLAKAVAGETELPFLNINTHDLVSSVQHGTATKIQQIFAAARDIAPCIIFIDEIDMIAGRRDRAGADTSAVNTLLTNLDGLQAAAEPVFVIAATNYPERLDPALLRAGRLDEPVHCDLPDRAARQAFFEMFAHRYGVQLSSEQLADFAEMTQGMSGAQLEKAMRLCMLTEQVEQHGAAGLTIAQLRKAVTAAHYGAPLTSLGQSPQEKKLVAYHEAGHLLVSRLLMPHYDVPFATIEPRNNALGFVVTHKDATLAATTMAEIKAKIAMSMAGREAEAYADLGGEANTGAASDISYATQLAEAAVCQYGLDEVFGPVTPAALQQVKLTGAQADLVAERIKFWVTEGQQQAAALLAQQQELLHKIAAALYRNESLYGDEIDELFADA